jgi:hypothetical protein
MAGTNGEIPTYSELTGVSYLIKYERLVFDLLPKRYRKIKLYKYLLTSIYSLYRFWNYIFLPYRESSLREIRINSSTIVLEHWLNYTFNTSNIEIINTSYVIGLTYIYRKGETGDASNLQTFIYRKGESNPTPQVFIYRKTEFESDVDFTVKIPQTLLDTGVTQNQIIAIIDKYVALGVIYKIVVF